MEMGVSAVSVKIYRTILLFLCLCAGGNMLLAADNPVELIQQDFQRGEIDYTQSLLYQLMLVRGDENLPSQYIPAERFIDRSATPLFWEIKRNFDDLSSADKNTLRDYLSRPSNEFSMASPGGNFRIHYSLTGANAVASDDIDPSNGIPDYVDWVAESMDSAYACLHTHLGYAVPPTDGSEGGDDKYDVYILEVPYYGLTQPEDPGPESWDDYTSYMVINNNFIGFPPNDDPDGDVIGDIRITCSHEYFHAVQYGYALPNEYWFMEASSTWMEEICYPLVNDNYNYIDSFFLYPQLSLNSEYNWHHYGAFVWNRFIDQYFDTTLVRLAWEDYRFTNDSYIVLDNVLNGYGSGLNEAFAEFALWNWCTAGRSDGNHYPDGDDYPAVDISANVSFYPFNGGVPPADKKPDGLSANYIKFTNPTGKIGDLYIYFDGQDGIDFKANIILAESGNNYNFTEIPLDSEGRGEITIPDFDLLDYVVLNPVVLSWSADSIHYDYSADLLAWPDYEVAVDYIEPVEIYSNASRIVQFEIINLGSKGGLYFMSVADDMGWETELIDSFQYLAVRDTVTVSVELQSAQGLVPGTINNVYLTSTLSTDSAIHGTGALPAEIVRRNGDSNNDGKVNVSDAVYIINFVFSSGAEPIPELFAGDANCDDRVNVSDAVYIINYVFSGGSEPPCWIY